MPMYFEVRGLCTSSSQAAWPEGLLSQALQGPGHNQKGRSYPQRSLRHQRTSSALTWLPTDHTVEVILPPRVVGCSPGAMLLSAHRPSQAGRAQGKPARVGSDTGDIIKSLAGNTSLDKSHLPLQQE